MEKMKETKYGLMPVGEERRKYKLTKDTFGGKRGDIVEIRVEPIDGSYWMDNVTRGNSVQPFVDFEAIKPYNWEMNSNCPPGKEWVKGFTKKDGTRVHGYCREI